MSIAGHARDMEQIAALERAAKTLAESTQDSEVYALASEIALRLWRAGKALFNGDPSEAARLSEGVLVLAARIDLLLVEQAPVADTNHPAWDVLFAWRDAVAKCGGLPGVPS